MILHLTSINRPATQESFPLQRSADHYGDGDTGDGDGNGGDEFVSDEWETDTDYVEMCVSQMYLLAQVLGDDP